MQGPSNIEVFAIVGVIMGLIMIALMVAHHAEGDRDRRRREAEKEKILRAREKTERLRLGQYLPHPRDWDWLERTSDAVWQELREAEAGERHLENVIRRAKALADRREEA